MEKYRGAGRKAAEIREWSKSLVKPGAKAIEVADAIEKKILSSGGGIAFPVNVSLNDVAAHYAPKFNDPLAFTHDDVVTIDLGLHIDGYIADTAYTIDLSRKHKDLVKASEAGLDAAIKTMGPGASIKDIGKNVQEAINSFGYKPIENLTGHQLEQYGLHAGIPIPNVPTSYDFKLEPGMAFAVEPFASSGTGRVVESQIVEIYSFIERKPTRMREGAMLFEQIEERKGLPFAARWLSKSINPLKLKLLLKELVQRDALRQYPMLHDPKGLVSQAEHTVLITENGCEVTTK